MRAAPRSGPRPDAPPVSDEWGERLAQAAGADERFFEIAELFDERHPAGSYYYLQFLGVEPERQGRGIGSAMLDHTLQRCDREGVRPYLDATSPRNKRLYERHGFRATGEFAPRGGPPIWAMWREPKD
jgi:GNAT superfamily N-acetyltransferase